MTPRRPKLAAAVLGALLLGGCSGTPFGDRLANSFSSAPQAADPPARQATTPATTAAAPTAAKPAAPLAQPATGSKPVAAKQAPIPSRAMAPAPYRITIRLPSGDPSAPAEVVTQALRAAGVPFEVEMIERISPGAAAGSGAPTGTPLPAPAPAPRSR